MAYTKTVWVNNVTPLNADNLNKIENKLESVDAQITQITSSGDTSHTHTNLTVLNALSDSAGVLQYNGQPIQGTGSGDFTISDSLTNGNIIVNGSEIVVYEHSSEHPASMITQDSTHRFVTDAQITNWNSGTGGSGSTDSVYVNVKTYGAVGDGVTDDTSAINSAINYANSIGGATVIIPEGTYMINADWNSGYSIQVKSNVKVLMQSGTILKAKTNNLSNYSVLRFKGVSNASIYGGTIYGERTTHTGSGGEWGHGITVNESTDITIDGVVCKNCWGDGIYLTGATAPAKNVKIHNCICDNNRRQGCSVVYADGVIISDCIFRNTNGTPPMAGIDLEPNSGTTVNNVQVVGCIAYNNSGSGFVSVVYTTESSFIGCHSRANKEKGFLLAGNSSSTVVANCEAVDNLQEGFYVGYSEKNIISQNLIARNGTYGIYVMNSSPNNTISNNVITGNASGGIYIYHGENAIIVGNRITNNTGSGLVTQSTGGIDIIENNIVTGNSGAGISVSSTPSVVVGNCITGNTGTELSVSTSNGSINANNYVS